MSSLPTISGSVALRPIESLQSNPSPEPNLTLTRKQKRFIEFFLQGKSAKESALLANYKPSVADVATTAILYKPAVQFEIKRRQEEIYKKLEINTEEIISRIQYLAEANLADYIDIDPSDGEKFKINLNKLDRLQFSAIQELNYDALGRPKIKLVDKKAYHDLLCRVKKIGADDQHRSGSDLTIQALDAIVNKQSITYNHTTINVGSTSSPNTKQAKTIEAEVEK